MLTRGSALVGVAGLSISAALGCVWSVHSSLVLSLKPSLVSCHCRPCTNAVAVLSVLPTVMSQVVLLSYPLILSSGSP